MGVEIIAVTAGEAQHPEVTIPRAMRNIVYRLILVLCAGDCNHGHDGSLEPDRQFAFRQSFCDGVRCGAYTLCCRDHELCGAHGGAFQREHQPLSCNPNAFLSGPGRLCARMDGQGKRQRSAASRSAGFNRRDHRGHLLAIYAPKNAFLMLYGTAVAGMLFVWLVILNTHLRFRKTITASGYRGCRCVCGRIRFLL